MPFCPTCGREVRSDMDYCAGCGAKLATVAVASSLDMAAERRSAEREKKVALVIVFAVAGIAFLLFWTGALPGWVRAEVVGRGATESVSSLDYGLTVVGRIYNHGGAGTVEVGAMIQWDGKTSKRTQTVAIGPHEEKEVVFEFKEPTIWDALRGGRCAYNVWIAQPSFVLDLP